MILSYTGRIAISDQSGQPVDNSSPDMGSIADELGRLNMESIGLDRSNSVGSHRTKHSHWKPVNHPNPEYVKAMLTRILNDGNKKFDALLANRVYHQLDWRDRGYLFRAEVERHLSQAATEAPYPISNATLMDTINSCDENRDGRIDRQELIQICRKLLSHLEQAYEAEAEAFTRQEGLRGGAQVRLDRAWLAEDTKPCLGPLTGRSSDTAKINGLKKNSYTKVRASVQNHHFLCLRIPSAQWRSVHHGF